MDSLLTEFQQNLAKTVQLLKEDLKLIRTGRATPALVEDLIIETYAGQTKLKLLELATITIDSPTSLLVAPFDPSTISDIEKAILKSTLGFSPQTQGSRIIIKIPPLSQEQREKMIKLIGQKVEEKKSIIRNHRDDLRRKIKLRLEQSMITEDDKFRTEKEIDSLTHKQMEELDRIRQNKESEIRQV